jgi:hypothetical protein
MEYYPYALQFPYTGTTLIFKELTSLQQITLNKINSTLPPTPEYRVDYFKILIDIISDTLKHKEKLTELNLVEFLMFLIRLRAVSIGSAIEFSVEDKETDKNKKISFDIYTLLNNIFNISSYIEKYQFIEDNNVCIKLTWPFLMSEENFLSSLKKEYSQRFMDSMYEFIENIEIGSQVFNFKNYNKEQKEKMFDLLPLSVKNIIQTNVVSLLKEASEEKLFEIEQFESYRFELFNCTLQDIIRFLFVNDEQVLMKENLFLINKGLSLNDIYNMSPLSKTNYINLILASESTNETPVQ